MIFPRKRCYGSKRWIQWSTWLTSSRPVAGKNFPNFEKLDAKIASALKKNNPDSYFQKKVSLEEQKVQKEDWFLRGRQIAFMIYDYFRVTGAHGTVLDYADLFSITLQNDNVQEFDTRWDEILLSMTKVLSDEILESLYKLRIRGYEILLVMTKILSDEILESLYKLRIRVSEQLKTVFELYEMEIHQKTSMPNCQRLKTMVKRSIDQELRLRNFDARHEKIKTGAVVKSHRRLSSVWKGKGICYSGKGSVRRETNAVSNDRAKPTPKGEPPFWAINDTR